MATEATGKNQVGHMYGLFALCPIKIGAPPGENRSNESMVRGVLADLGVGKDSPFARIANTYFGRFFVLKNVFYESKPAIEEHLKSPYLVFVAEFHGELETYLSGMWDSIEPDIRRIWGHCVAFEKVGSAHDFVSYIKRCQVNNSLLFQGSTDEPLDVQLKSLYLKQEFGRFVVEHQGRSASELKAAFTDFVAQVQVDNLEQPTWQPGAGSLEDVVVS